jgi:formate hydrogenlyase transcriptional activator
MTLRTHHHQYPDDSNYSTCQTLWGQRHSKSRILGTLNLTSMQLQEEQISFREGFHINQDFPEIIGRSSELQHTLRLISRVAPTNSTVLVLGETGTGKQLVARAIHDHSSRKTKKMVKVNCATLPPNLIESELFGHERGSFTGATDRRVGKFEQAHHSTLFLDEVGELPLELQVKLLRALQEREIERIGGHNTIQVNVRIIAATNRNLEEEVEASRFRADLYYRLNIFPISLPPLRSRREDIPLLAAHFIQKLSIKVGIKITKISKYVFEQIIDYDWPGNIRELEHVIERSILLSDDNFLSKIYLPDKRQKFLATSAKDGFVVKTIEENERDHIVNVLKYCKGKVAGFAGAAKYLGIPPSTLSSKLKRLGIQKAYH